MAFIGNQPTAVPLTSSQLVDGIITTAKIADGAVVNVDVNSTAAIAYSKLNLATSIVNGDIANATIALAKLSATGTPSASTFLRGDNVWNTPPAGAFVFLGETTASNVATVDLNGYFTSDYDIYKIFIDGLYGSVNDVRVLMRFATTGSYTVQTSNYYSANAAAYQYSASQGVYGEGAFNNASAIICEYISSTSSQQSNIELTLYNPLTTSYVKSYTNSFSGRVGNITQTRSGAGGGSWNDTTAITGVRFIMDSGNISARKIKIYGIKNS